MDVQKFSFDLGLNPGFEKVVKKMLGLKRAEEIYSQVRSASPKGLLHSADFCKRALRELRVSYQLPSSQLDQIKEIEGPLMFVANHPLGAIDALVLMILMSEVRSESKFMGNAILSAFPELDSILFPVDIRDQQKNQNSNAVQLLKVYRYLKSGGLLGMFPAGEVSTQELDWNPHVGSLVKNTQATVVPIFFESKNSNLFHVLAIICPALRIALLAREMLGFQKEVRFKVGDAIPYSEVKSFQTPEAITDFLQRRTLQMKS